MFTFAIILTVITLGLIAAAFIVSPHDPVTADKAQEAAKLSIQNNYGQRHIDGINVSFPVNTRRLLRRGAAVTAILTLLFLGFSTVRTVPVHSVGVKTAFGKIEGALRPGWHWFNAPWTKVNILDETIQTTTFYGTGKNGTCMPVRIGGQQLACLNITIKWQIEDPAAPGLFNQYDNNGTTVQKSITKNLVINDLRTTANNVFGDYNPIEDATLTAVKGGSVTAPSQFSTFGPTILNDMRGDLRNQISITSINLSNAYYNSATESRLAGVANQFAATAQASQQIITDQKLAAANDALTKSLTPLIVQNNCVTITDDLIKAGNKMNVGWNCFGGSAVVGAP